MNSIHWFRKGLRVHDNPALLYSLRNGSKVYTIFILDPFYVQSKTVGANRWRFLLQALEDLNVSLKKLGSRLLILQGKPEEILQQKLQEWKIGMLTFEKDTEPYAKIRDQTVQNICKKYKVKLYSQSSHTLYDMDHLYVKNAKIITKTYGSFLQLINKMGPPSEPLDPPSIEDFMHKNPEIPENLYKVPTMSQLKLDEQKCGPRLYPGGQTEALKRMQKYISNKRWICEFQKPNTSPNSLIPSTTVLSPYLKFGNLSSRLFYHQIKQIYKTSKHSLPPVSLEGQLLWRQFFYFNGTFIPNFDKIKDNPICKQIKWDENQQYFQAWKNGRTGFPFIDAIMTQLREEGWIHHLARHAVACFLTRGDLYISWERGKDVFQNLLLDADWSLNAANWMWLSCSAFFHQYFRVYSPIAFGKKTDPKGDYIRKYLPKLRKFPMKYIYEPWNAPLNVQKQSDCIIGIDYPAPIVDHSIVNKENMTKMSKYYGQKQDTTQN